MNNNVKRDRRSLKKERDTITVIRPRRLDRINWGHYAPQVIKFGVQPRLSKMPKVGGKG